MINASSRERVLVVDVETTGLDPKEDRILELSIAEFPDGIRGVKPARIECWGFDVGEASTSHGAYAVNGIDPADQRGWGMFADYVWELDDWLSGDFYIAGHQVDFDIDFLRAEFERAVGMPCPWNFRNRICTKQAVRMYMPLDKSTSLDNSLELMCVPGREREHHEAAEDVRLTAKLLYKLIRAHESGFETAVEEDLYPLSFDGLEDDYGSIKVEKAGEAMLKEMEALIGSRDGEDGSHGSFESNADIAQDIKDVYRKHEGFFKLTKQERESLDNMAIKQCRIISAPLSQDLDSWTDIGGYAFLGRRYRERRHLKGENK